MSEAGGALDAILAHVEDFNDAGEISTLHRVVEEHESMSATVKELEGQVLALREAMTNYNYRGGEVHLQRTLADTAQAGREAEARIVNETLNRIMVCEPKMMEIIQQHLRDITANRLRNGGSDSE